jgi:hypothetical protein
VVNMLMSLFSRLANSSKRRKTARSSISKGCSKQGATAAADKQPRRNAAATRRHVEADERTPDCVKEGTSCS